LSKSIAIELGLLELLQKVARVQFFETQCISTNLVNIRLLVCCCNHVTFDNSYGDNKVNDEELRMVDNKM